MSPLEPVDPRVRLAIAQWPDDAPRGSVTTFCLEHDLSRKTFYAIRKRAQQEGQAAALEQSGFDHGPISVHDKMRSVGMGPVPAVSSLAGIFRDAGVARLEPKKKPQASYRSPTSKGVQLKVLRRQSITSFTQIVGTTSCSAPIVRKSTVASSDAATRSVTRRSG